MGLSGSTDLNAAIQQLVGQNLQREAAVVREARQLPDVPAVAHVSHHVTRVVHVQGLEVIVDGVAHDHLALQHTENLEGKTHGTQSKDLHAVCLETHVWLAGSISGTEKRTKITKNQHYNNVHYHLLCTHI